MLEKLKPSDHLKLEFQLTGDKEVDNIIRTLASAIKWRWDTTSWFEGGRFLGDPSMYIKSRRAYIQLEGEYPQDWLQNAFNRAAKNKINKTDIEASAKLVEEVLLENDKLKKQNNKLALKIKNLEKEESPWYHEDKKRKSKGTKATEPSSKKSGGIPEIEDTWYDIRERVYHYRSVDGSKWIRPYFDTEYTRVTEDSS